MGGPSPWRGSIKPTDNSYAAAKNWTVKPAHEIDYIYAVRRPNASVRYHLAMERRDFLAGAAALATHSVKAASDRVNVGLIGCGGRGRYVAQQMRAAAGVSFGAVCDVYQPNASKAREWAGAGAREYGDFRRLLEQRDLDAVLIATPDHWHAAIAVLACQAGKDVYVEKPLAHNVREGQAIVTAARQYNRIVQTGTQQRSATHFPELARIIQSGELGEVKFVRVWNFLNMYPNGIGRSPDSAPPAGLDWEFWLGPAPKVPFNPKRFLATFRWFRDYAGGFITDFGTHRFDTVHQIMGATAPRTVVATGGRYVLNDAGEMPDIMQVTYEYPNFVMSYECNLLNGHGLGGRTAGQRYYNMRGREDRPHGMAFYGTRGSIFADRIGYDIYPEENTLEKIAGAERIVRKNLNTTDATGLHTANFIECVRSRKPPAGEVAIGHRSTTVGHLGNIALLTGKKLAWDAGKQDFVNEPAASRLLSREPRQGWDLLGPV